MQIQVSIVTCIAQAEFPVPPGYLHPSLSVMVIEELILLQISRSVSLNTFAAWFAKTGQRRRPLPNAALFSQQNPLPVRPNLVRINK